MRYFLRRDALGLALGAIVAVGPFARGAAQEDSATRAEALFRSGKERMAVGDFAQACPRLKESYELDAATGSLLALAVCYERDQNLAAAYGTYQEVVRRATAEGRTDRARAASAKLIALDEKITTLSVFVTQPADGSAGEVRVNGSLLAAEQIGVKLPMVGTLALVEASAPGKQPWRISLPLGASHQTLSVTVPVLEKQLPLSEPLRLKPPVPEPAPAKVIPAVAAQPARSLNLYGRVRVSGLALMGAGGVGLAIAAGYTVRAAHLRNSSNVACDGNLCTAHGRALRIDAHSAGTAATIAVSAGALLAASGAASYLWGRYHDDGERPPSARVRASGWALPSSVGAIVRGSF